MPAYIINEGIVSGGMFIAIGESIIARAAALGGYISFSLTACLKTPYEQVPVPGTSNILDMQREPLHTTSAAHDIVCMGTAHTDFSGMLAQPGQHCDTFRKLLARSKAKSYLEEFCG